MSFDYIRKLPTPDEIREQYPVPDSLVPIKQKRDAEIRDVLTGKSDKLLVIIGPCSADNEDAVCDYIHRLAKVNDKVSDRLILIPRIYTNKPRTTGDGYKGIVHQPDPLHRCFFLQFLRHALLLAKLFCQKLQPRESRLFHLVKMFVQLARCQQVEVGHSFVLLQIIPVHQSVSAKLNFWLCRLC